MKRSEVIKVPDPNSLNSGSGPITVVQKNPQAAASIAPVFPQRPSVIEIPNLPLQAHRAGVTVYRGDSANALPTAVPPAAHTGVVVTATPTGVPLQPPTAVLHGPPQSANQPLTSIKPESVNLPTVPVSLQFANTFPGGATITGVSGPPSVVKTLASSLPIHTLQQPVQASVQPKPQNLNVGTALRTMTTVPQTNTTTFTPTTVSASSAASNSNNTNFQRLKVEDALSYLDQVKFKFGNQPQVYNDFLDIMKEFKSQSIDTPGVIARVSSLFRGHPELIVGFNTFLPPGYKIEVHSNDSTNVSMSGSVGKTVQTIVHTPHGIHKMTTHGSGPLTSVTTPNIPQPMTQPPPATNIIRTPVPSSPNLATISTSKFHPQQQLGLKFETASATTFQVGVRAAHLPTAPLHPSATTITIPGGGGQIQVRQQAQQQAPSGHSAAAASAMQPIEFNHAINYVNKIKNRFQGQPDIYKQFLEILHTYQKDQKAIKEGQKPTGPYLTEAEVYGQVAKLFQNQEDLLAEFGQFLPEATGEGSALGKGMGLDKKPLLGGIGFKFGSPILGSPGSGTHGSNIRPPGATIKRPLSGVAHPPPKKQKTGVLRDVSLAEAGKFGSLNEYAFFDKVRKALRNQDVYDNFLRCLVLFNQEVISRGELIQLTTPFLSRHPELFKWFKDFVGYREGGNNNCFSSGADSNRDESMGLDEERNRNETERGARERITGDSAMEIDYATCKRLGASYCALPKNFVQPSCSGRTSLCHQVLNDTWVSFPSWSEDSQFVTSRKTQYEEAVYRTEDERFEFDVVLETNKDTIKVLECVQKKMSRMPPEEAARYRLDDCLGGTSSTIHQRAIRRIYGDKSGDIIEGLKRNPVVAVPLVLRRLRAKDEEWREVQKNFNKIWRDQNEKYYLKSLDHQSLMFKQSDIRNLRSKSLLNEIETLYDERHEQNEEHETARPAVTEGPHVTFSYQDFSILDDANNLLIHHVKRQTSIHKEDKHKIKVLLKHFLMDRFKHPRQDLSEDEREEEDDSGKEETEVDSEPGKGSSRRKKSGKDEGTKDDSKSGTNDESKIEDVDIKVESKDGRRTPLHARDMEADESYTLFLANNHWYLFLRLHHILCERLSKMYNQAIVIANDEGKDKRDKKESTAVALRLKPESEIEPEDYYPTFLDMVKNLLDGNLDGQAYEDTLREMFGIHAYVSFTLDKVVGNAVRQLQHLVTDDSCIECYDLFVAESKNRGTGGNCGSAAERQIAEIIYQKKAEKLLADENCMKVIIYHQSGNMTIELLDTETEEGQDSDKDEETARKFQSYIDRFIGPDDDISDECRQHLVIRPIFLPRSIKSFNTRSRLRESKMRQTPTKQQEDDAEKAKSDSGDSERLELKKEDDVMLDDNTQCQFSLKNFKILYIVNSENCFYRRLALRRAKESHKTVSHRKQNAFSRWHASWVRQNVTDESHQSIDSWFMGKTEDLCPNRTQRIVRNFMDRTPYRTYHKYHVEMVKSS